MAQPIDSKTSSTSLDSARLPGPRRSRRRFLLALVLLAGLVLIAIVALQRSVPRDPDQLLQQAQNAYRDAQYDRADRLLDRLATLREPLPLDLLLRAQVALATDRQEEALLRLKEIPEDHPIAPVARVLQGQIEAGRGRIPAAEAAFLDAVRLEPRYVQARRELAFIYSIQRRLSELDEQLAALSRLGELVPSYVLHWSKIRNVNWNYEKDLDNLHRFLEGDPDDRWSRLTLAEAMRRSGNLSEAERVLSPLPRSDPEAAAQYALLAIDAGDLDQAEAVLDETPADHPSVALIRGELALLSGDPEAALPFLSIAEQANPIDRRILAAIGRALTLLGRSEEAEPVLERVRRHDQLGQLVARATSLPEPNDPDLCVAIGKECLAIGRRAEARAWFDTALAVDPFHDEAQQALARFEKADGEGPF